MASPRRGGAASDGRLADSPHLLRLARIRAYYGSKAQREAVQVVPSVVLRHPPFLQGAEELTHGAGKPIRKPLSREVGYRAALLRAELHRAGVADGAFASQGTLG